MHGYRRRDTRRHVEKRKREMGEKSKKNEKG